LSGAYVLYAIDEVERAAFERHLRECDACRQEVRELRATAVHLADDVAAVPPPRLRAKVLSAVARSPQLRSAGAGRESRAPADRWRRRTAAAVAAAVVGLAAGVGTWTVADDRVQRARSDAAAERDRAREIEQVLAARDVRLLREEVTGGGAVNVAVAPSRDSAVAVLAGLPVPPEGLVYQLWLLRDGTPPQSLDVLGPGQTGATRLIRGVGATGAFGVSLERGPRGAATPSPGRIVKRMNLR
jgi:anti-sigma-K factor RskA